MFFDDCPHSSVKKGMTHNKRESFRAEIRRESIQARIREQRRHMVDRFEFQALRDILHNLDQNYFSDNQHKKRDDGQNRSQKGFSKQKLEHAIYILDSYSGDAAFNLQAGTEKLQEVFANILLNFKGQINLQEKTRLISALNYLTYYNDSSAYNLSLKVQFTDYLREEISSLSMSNTEQIQFVIRIVVLFMNITALLKQEYNLYLAESDVCKCIQERINITFNLAKHSSDSEYVNAVGDFRESTLRLFKNIVGGLSGRCSVGVGLVWLVVCDVSYFLSYPERVFLLLQQGMRIDNFWQCLHLVDEQQLLCIHLSQMIDLLQLRCSQDIFLYEKKVQLTDDEYRCFYAMLRFLNKLNYQDGNNFNILFNWNVVVEELLNGYMLAYFLKSAVQKKHKQEIRVALTTYLHLSEAKFVTGEQLILIRPGGDSSQQLLGIWCNQQLLSSGNSSSLCLSILVNLLRKDRLYFERLMQMRILDGLLILFEKQGQRVDILVGAISLARELFVLDVRVMLQVMDNKGIVKRIQNLTSHSNRKVFLKAEMFVEEIGQQMQKRQRL